MVENDMPSVRLLVADPADPHVARVEARGSFDRGSCHQLTAAVEQALSTGRHTLVIVVRHIIDLDAATIRALLTCRELALTGGGSLRVVNDSGIVARLLDLSDTRRLLCPPDPTASIPAESAAADNLGRPVVALRPRTGEGR
ncbi:hypothetical protein ACWT_2129 [Actinoplanes sp. SE50]|uniref:STAS domain-containing protein n=1 Tax=unclassified Actinoplanes TaxID=2626549 RepID=UPI00023EC92D|nr:MULTISPECIES: STAS domain-containing protein [unclassified Actinoplanes]AEV83151.1 hypothetical protein ACPL_2254 [Actinoplanes sp. SE50/110]ATO81544.1 hypothetical protein ACWT_2129 [Actinoplanes sp. SE50]SLL98952.1 hypothetical protein ACSP50_2179 [Actinoplanes sp. SE50/110]